MSDINQLQADIDSVFRRIAELQREPVDGSGQPGFNHAENVLGRIERMISMARFERTKLDRGVTHDRSARTIEQQFAQATEGLAVLYAVAPERAERMKRQVIGVLEGLRSKYEGN